MIFMLAYMFLFFGIFLAGMSGLMPANIFIGIPMFLRLMLFIVGFIISLVGLIILQGRAVKTGATHLLEFGRPGKIIWFYVYKDGSIKITPSVREIEGHLYSQELDALIHELKSYKLFDHSIRFVPEGTGHAVDLGMCLYASFLKTKYGFAGLREARQSFFNRFGMMKTKSYETEEMMYKDG